MRRFCSCFRPQDNAFQKEKKKKKNQVEEKQQLGEGALDVSVELMLDT